MQQDQCIFAGLDVGSVTAKMTVRVPDEVKDLFAIASPLRYLATLAGGRIYGMSAPVYGEPVKVIERMMRNLLPLCSNGAVFLQFTGMHAKRIAETLAVPYINEFKAIAGGVVELVPEAQTILEMGGDGSRFIHMRRDAVTGRVFIVDYGRNGDCAAGTGSFIDQQAARLRFAVENIGELVMTADTTANIAGRCSVFAKTDMVHAQQRGYSPAAIFKGLCQAVVRNYKATVLRGKVLQAPVVLVGGVAANLGVVRAMEEILQLGDGRLIVPPLHLYAAALGCAVLSGGVEISAAVIDRLQNLRRANSVKISTQKILDASLVQFVANDIKATTSSRAVMEAYLGIDVGSVSTNLILLDQEGNVIDEVYTRTDGRPVEVVQRELGVWRERWGDRLHILGVGTTGSGREIIGELVGADTINDEITAHKTGANHIAQRIKGEPVDTIFEIGGQDAKYISIQDGVVVDFTMNEACAAGTGSFLEEQASKLGISIVDEFSALALASRTPVQMGERCTVFMEKDVTAYLQRGMAKADITAGLAFAVVQNYLNRVVRGRKIGRVIYFQGGTAYNHAVAAAFAVTLGKRIIVPPHCGVMGAIGVALLAKEKRAKNPQPSRFYGFDLQRVPFQVRQFTCKHCSNRCDMQEVTVHGEKTYWGDKCSERYRRNRRVGYQGQLVDLIEFYQKQLQVVCSAPNGLGIKIGIPRTMYFYDRYPFWSNYFCHLGAEIVLSETTNRHTVSRGREYCITEPCFPIIAGYGHVVELLQRDADYVFVPNVINAEAEDLQTESWYCPWGQTLPLVIKNTLFSSPWHDRLLTPVIRFRDGREEVNKALWPVAQKLGVGRRRHHRAVEMAYAAQQFFNDSIKQAGAAALAALASHGAQAVVMLGRPYNVYDQGLNLNVPRKLRQHYGINVIPLEFLPIEGIDIRDHHENMFWSYGRKILQAAVFIGRMNNLHAIYFTNFKCGPDSYIKHYIQDAIGAPYLTLQFDEHSNDAGILTRCEAYLQSKNLLAAENTRSFDFYEKAENLRNDTVR